MTCFFYIYIYILRWCLSQTDVKQWVVIHSMCVCLCVLSGWCVPHCWCPLHGEDRAELMITFMTYSSIQVFFGQKIKKRQSFEESKTTSSNVLFCLTHSLTPKGVRFDRIKQRKAANSYIYGAGWCFIFHYFPFFQCFVSVIRSVVDSLSCVCAHVTLILTPLGRHCITAVASSLRQMSPVCCVCLCVFNCHLCVTCITSAQQIPVPTWWAAECTATVPW